MALRSLLTGSNNGGTGTSATSVFTLTGAEQVGDVVTVVLFSATNVDTIAAGLPAGFTVRAGPNVSGTVMTCYIVTGTLTAAMIAGVTLTFTWSGAHKIIEAGFVLAGVAESSVIIGTGTVITAGAPVNSVTQQSVTTTVSGSDVITGILIRMGSGLAIVPAFPTGYGVVDTTADAIETSLNAGAVANFTGATVRLLAPGAAGTYGGGTITTTGASTVGTYTIAFAPSLTVPAGPTQPGKTWKRRFKRHQQALYDIPATGPTNVNLTGQVSPLALAAPTGAVALNVNLTGAVSPLTLAAPAGSLNLSVNVTAAPATLVLAAPAGAVSLGVNLTAAVSPIALAAPAGSLNLSVNLTAAPAPLALAAPAGTVSTSGSVNLTGQVSALALAAPAGTVSATTNVTLAGALSTFTLTPFAGSVAATTVVVTYKFVSPLTYTVKDTANQFWDRFAQQRSKSILKFGTQYQTVIGPSAEQVEAADVTYLGGHEYKISAAEAAALTAAGYGAGVTTS